MKKYNVLKPIYTAERYVPGFFFVSWLKVGEAGDMEEARKFVPFPVLEKRV